MATEEQRQIRAITSQLKLLASRVVAKISLDVTANLIESTPRDTGWAANNWIPAIGSPVEEPAGSRDAVSGAAQSAGQAALLGYRIELGRVFIANNVPYILPLNDGHSQQAPAGFIEEAIIKGTTIDIRGLET
jgi:hypothetical protein